MKTPNFKVGMIVEHPTRPQWGPGKVVGISEERVHVVFRNEMAREAKTIMTGIITLNVAADQSDAMLDILPPATQEGGNWVLPKNYERLIQKRMAPAKT